MTAPRSEDWKDVKPINAFTSRNTAMYNLNTGEVVQYYSANTKIVVVQKYVTPSGTYYRTRSAEHHDLNWAFEASAFGLPNEAAPSVPLRNPPTTLKVHRRPAPKQKYSNTPALPKDGECKAPKKGLKAKFISFFKRK